MAFVSVTRLRVRLWRYLPVFFLHALRSLREAELAEGIVAADVFRDARWTFWTRTVWRDEAAMRAYVMSETHREAMAYLPEWCDEASVVHWTQALAQAPSWPEAYRRMQQQGRPSKVKHPSEAQLRFKIAAPRYRYKE